MIRDDLVKVIDDWHKTIGQDTLYPRELLTEIDTETQEVVDIVGPRRSGKSFILKLLIQKLGNNKNWLYVNFEDPFFVLNNEPRIIEQLIETYKEYFSPNLQYLFFDEIQNIHQWESAIRKLRDAAGYKIYITGSSSKLLSGELATLLSGRHLSYQLFPLSFAEYLTFKGVDIPDKKGMVVKELTMLKYFDNYVAEGGFPQVVLTGKKELAKQYYIDIVERDIIKRYDVREKEVLEKLGLFLLGSSAKTASIAQLKKTYGISFVAASTYIEYFKDAFVVFDTPQFSYSLKRQQKSLKKIYAVDTGLANAVSFRLSEDKGRLLETAVFLHLKRLGKDIFYYKTQKNTECDFVIKQQDTMLPIQVSWNLVGEKTKQREQAALLQTMDELHTAEGLLLSRSEQGDVTYGAKHITIQPVFRWMLENRC